MARNQPIVFTQHIPAEIRHIIYTYALEDTYPSHSLKLYKPYNRLEEEHLQRAFQAGQHRNDDSLGLTEAEYRAANIWYTPSLLLVCKQVTAEALPILRLQTFHLDCRTPGSGESPPLRITDFVRPDTIRNLSRVSVKMPFFEQDQDPVNATMNTILSLLKESTKLTELGIHFIWVFSQPMDTLRHSDVQKWIYRMLAHRKTEAQMHQDAILLCDAGKGRSYRTTFEYDLAGVSNGYSIGESNRDGDGGDLVILAKDTLKPWGFRP